MQAYNILVLIIFPKSTRNLASLTVFLYDLMMIVDSGLLILATLYVGADVHMHACADVLIQAKNLFEILGLPQTQQTLTKVTDNFVFSDFMGFFVIRVLLSYNCHWSNPHSILHDTEDVSSMIQWSTIP